jgi:hypothetical protein
MPIFRRRINTKSKSEVTATDMIVQQIATGSQITETAIFHTFLRSQIWLLGCWLNLLKFGTASVERSFSNLNRIIDEKRNFTLHGTGLFVCYIKN